MKKYGIILLSALSFFMTSCGTDTAGNYGDSIQNSTSENITETQHNPETSETENDTIAASHIEMKTKVQIYSEDIKNEIKPETDRISIIGICSGNIKRKAYISDLYNIDILHSGVVGLVGIPAEIKFDDDIKNTQIVFHYNEHELRGIPEENLILLYYNETTGTYDEVPDIRLDKDRCSVSVKTDKQGVYMLADIYQWRSAWGIDASEYAYEINKSDFISDWERECDTGDIMKIADKEWAAANAPYFSVSTAEQLAGAVYYVNAIAKSGEEVCIYLENDIDISGYEWKPMGWGGSSNNCFTGIIDGQGHTINGLKISDEWRTAFIGYGLNTQVYNISFTNAEISGNSYVGIVGGEIYTSSNWHDIHVSGTVEASGNDDYGTIIGRESDMSFKNCTYDDVIVNGEPFGYPSYLKKIKAETEVVEAFTLFINDDGFIERTDVSGYDNLTWCIVNDGEISLMRNAENELVLKYSGEQVYLTAYINGAYIRVSNIIE